MRVQTVLRPRRRFPDMTPAQREAGLRAAVTDELQAVTRDIETNFPAWQRSAQLREAYAIMIDELRAREHRGGRSR